MLSKEGEQSMNIELTVSTAVADLALGGIFTFDALFKSEAKRS